MIKHLLQSAFALLIFLTALCCAPMRATPLVISFDSPALTGSPGDVVQFFGTLTNTTGADLYLNADSFDLPGFDPSAIDDSPFFTNAPLFLSAGASSGDIGLFNVSIPNGFATGSYPGTFEVLGGPTSIDQTIIGSDGFTVNVQAGGAPEPSSFAMFALAAMLAGVFRKRLRTLLPDQRG